MSIELVPLGTLRITIELQTVLPGVPGGTRLIGEASDCRWEGERVRARQLGRSASDWVLINPDASVSVDARILLETDDGALICMRYGGRATRPPSEGGVVITAPTFETNDERYAWLNTVQAVGKGVRDGASLTYELFAVT
jgi:Protein of unknown function (DUF3237)